MLKGLASNRGDGCIVGNANHRLGPKTDKEKCVDQSNKKRGSCLGGATGCPFSDDRHSGARQANNGTDLKGLSTGTITLIGPLKLVALHRQAACHERHVGAVHPELRGVLTIPTEAEQCVIAHKVRHPDLIAQQRAIAVVALTFADSPGFASAGVLGTTAEPRRRFRTAPIGMVDAVRVHWTILPWHVGARQDAFLKAIFQCSLLFRGGRVRWIDELRCDALVGAHAI